MGLLGGAAAPGLPALGLSGHGPQCDVGSMLVDSSISRLNTDVMFLLVACAGISLYVLFFLRIDN
jgi:hypothetical protein